MKKLLFTILLCFLTSTSFGFERLADFEEDSLPVLDENFRTLNETQDDIEDDVDTLETSVTAAETSITDLEAYKHRIQQVYTSDNTKSQISGAMIFDETKPQITEGGEVITLAITPTNAANILVIEFELNYEDNNGYLQGVALFQDSTADALRAWITSQPKPAATYFVPNSYHFSYRMIAGTTSATTFKVRVGPVNHDVDATGTLTLNGKGNTSYFGGTLENTLKITEYEV